MDTDGQLVCQSEDGTKTRPKGIPIDSLGQGDMARTIQRCGEDPRALLDFLDELIDLDELHEKLENARSTLSENCSLGVSSHCSLMTT